MTKFDRIAEKLAGTWDQRPDYEALSGWTASPKPTKRRSSSRKLSL